jgi:hypothetical protein
MRKIVFTLFVAVFSISTVCFGNEKTNDTETIAPLATVKILNDTANDVEIHTGSGYTKLNKRGGTTSVNCDAGKKIHFAENGKKGALIFTIDESMCGKTVKLSAYL